MRFSAALSVAALGLSTLASAAASWTFEDAALTIASKSGAEPLKHQLKAGSALTSAISLPPTGNLKLVLTTTEGKTGQKPHQAFLTLREFDHGLEESFPFTVKSNGKAKVDLAHKDLPTQFLTSTKPLKASIVIASFGASAPYSGYAFTLNVETDANAPPAVLSPPERYIAKPEIHHIFRADPRSPPTIISIFFAAAVVVTLPLLVAVWWGVLGANLDHFGKAFGASPVAHSLFLGSIVAMEGVFFMYYASWTLFQTLPAAGVVGIVAYISGSRALTEVQERRLAGER